MLELIRRLPPRFASREQAINGITAGGFPLGVAQWMATNLVRDEHPASASAPFAWKLDFDVMARLLQDFFDASLWDVVESASPSFEVIFVKATRSSAMSDAAVRRIEDARAPHVRLNHLEGGHWVHVESPQAIVELLVDGLPSH
jgi:hypothetical protein